jgi:hypothetical protein
VLHLGNDDELHLGNDDDRTDRDHDESVPHRGL